MTDLFGWQSPDGYPDMPGSKGSDGTSQQAADEMKPHVSHLRRLAIETLERLGAATPIEVASEAEVTREAMQPRLAELKKLGLVESTGERRCNPSGKSAAVLRLTDSGRAAL